MPVWHKAVQDSVKRGELVLLGITQELHAERCRLFAQWQQFNWPILHDLINAMGPRVVPIVVAIDEYDIVRSTRLRPNQFEAAFASKKFDPPEKTSTVARTAKPDIVELTSVAQQRKTYQAWRDLGDAAILWGDADQITTAIEAYSHAVKLQPSDGGRLSFAWVLPIACGTRQQSDRRAIF